MMPTLVERDESGILAPRSGEVEVGRNRTSRTYLVSENPDGSRTYRIGSSIGPVHHVRDGEWRDIDLTIHETPDKNWDHEMTGAGYEVRFWDVVRGVPYAAEFRRIGARVRMAPVGLAWINAAGERQIIARPTAGIVPAIHDDSITWEDAFGRGISFAYRVSPDGFRKVVHVDGPTSLPTPTISTKGLRLVVVMRMSWNGPATNGFANSVVTSDVESIDDSTLSSDISSTDETVDDPEPYAIRSGDGFGFGFWMQRPRTWDADGADIRMQYRMVRAQDRVYGLFGVRATDLREAVWPISIDTAITEERVGASTDDAEYVWNTYGTPVRNSVVSTLMYMCQKAHNNARVGFRWTTVPIPKGASIDSASFAMRVYSANYDDANFNVHCEDADDAATFSTTNHPATRTLTTAFTPWVAQGIGTGFKTSPDISSAVQEVVDRPGWDQNNSVVVITDQLSKDYTLWCSSYDSAASYGAKFNATYTVPPMRIPMMAVIG